MLSELAAKLGTNQTLSPAEIEQLQVALGDLERDRAYIASLRSGRASLSVDKLSAITAEFRFQPINMARMYSDSKDVSNFLQFNTTYTQFEANSYFELDPADNTKLLLKLPIAYLDQHRYLLTGVVASDSTTYKSLEMHFFNSSDVLVDNQCLNFTNDYSSNFSYTFPSVDTDITAVTYFKFKAAYNPANILIVEMYIHLVR